MSADGSISLVLALVRSFNCCCSSMAVADIRIGVVCLRLFLDMSGVESNRLLRTPNTLGCDDVVDKVVDGDDTNRDRFGALVCWE